MLLEGWSWKYHSNLTRKILFVDNICPRYPIGNFMNWHLPLPIQKPFLTCTSDDADPGEQAFANFTLFIKIELKSEMSFASCRFCLTSGSGSCSYLISPIPLCVKADVQFLRQTRSSPLLQKSHDCLGQKEPWEPPSKSTRGAVWWISQLFHRLLPNGTSESHVEASERVSCWSTHFCRAGKYATCTRQISETKNFNAKVFL